MFYIRCLIFMTTKTKLHLGYAKNGNMRMFNSPKAKGIERFDDLDSAIAFIEDNKDFIVRCGDMITKCQIVFKDENTPTTIMKEYAIIPDMLIKKGI